MDFRKLTFDDIDLVKEYISYQDYRTCDYSVGGIMMWRKFFNTHICFEDEVLSFRVDYLDEGEAFTFPVGKGDVRQTVRRLESCCRERGMGLKFCSVPDGALQILKDMYGERVHEKSNRDWFDYLYESEKMSTFAGKKLSGQRNHVNKFSRLYPDYRFVKLNGDNIERVRDFCRQYLANKDTDGETALEEAAAVLEWFEYYDRYNTVGGFIELDGRIIAASFGEVVGDTLFVHVEKAVTDYPGIYQVIVREFAGAFGKGIRYINREEDVGVEGLRKSKLSYHPTALLEKYTVDIQL